MERTDHFSPTNDDFPHLVFIKCTYLVSVLHLVSIQTSTEKMAEFNTSMTFADDASRWAAVVARAPKADGIFVYCVKTTRIYCRPVCKARLARRSNVEFYTLAREAERAGFRACKRCRPDLTSFNPEADVVKKICNIIRNSSNGTPPRLDTLAKAAGLTKSHFHRLFKKETGLTPREYALSCRKPNISNFDLDHLSDTTSNTPSTSEIFSCSTSTLDGTNESYDWDVFMEEIPVSETTKVGFDETDENIWELDKIPVSYTIRQTLHGALLVAFKDAQICRLELGETEAELLTHLEEGYPGWLYTYSPIAGDNTETMNQRVASIVEALERPTGKMLDLHLEPSLLDVLEPA